MLPIFVHIGSPKSGTSFLQEKIFLKCDNVLYKGRPTHTEGEFFSLHQAILHEQDGCRAREIILSLFKKWEEEAQELGKDRIIVSDETLSCAPFREILRERLPLKVLDIRIVISVRRQDHSIESLYGNHGRVLTKVPEPYTGKPVSLQDWWDLHRDKLDRDHFLALRYGSLSKMFCDSGTPVYCIAFEHLKKKHPAFLDTLHAICGQPPHALSKMLGAEPSNQRDSAGEVGLWRFMEMSPRLASLARSLPLRSALRRLAVRAMGGSKPYKVVLTDQMKAAIANEYAEENEILERLSGLDLRDLGYALPDDGRRDLGRAGGTGIK